MAERPLFLYGTLRYAPLFARLAGDGTGDSSPAQLTGHRVHGDAAGLPMLMAAPGQTAVGVLWRNLDPDRAARLDLYEVPFGYYRRPVTVRTATGPVAAEAYFPPDDKVAVGEWSLEDWIDRDSAASLLVVREITQHSPPLSGDDLVRQWPLMRARAEARLRAEAQTAPATMRHVVQEGDVTAEIAGALSGGFFKFAGMSLRHRRFDGGMSDALRREVFWGFDAALVLPYDPVHDVVLLVEQVRTGPVWRHDANPWTLEPVAGLIDAGETPEQAARREGREEADLAFRTLEPMFAAYPSPGGSADFFHCFLGVADLPEDLARHGGMDEEHEDLRLHRLSCDAAMALVASGEINALPLITMLYWLGANRARLRA